LEARKSGRYSSGIPTKWCLSSIVTTLLSNCQAVLRMCFIRA
jgi:hypothetical protein